MKLQRIYPSLFQCCDWYRVMWVLVRRWLRPWRAPSAFGRLEEEGQEVAVLQAALGARGQRGAYALEAPHALGAQGQHECQRGAAAVAPAEGERTCRTRECSEEDSSPGTINSPPAQTDTTEGRAAGLAGSGGGRAAGLAGSGGGYSPMAAVSSSCSLPSPSADDRPAPGKTAGT